MTTITQVQNSIRSIHNAIRIMWWVPMNLDQTLLFMLKIQRVIKASRTLLRKCIAYLCCYLIEQVPPVIIKSEHFLFYYVLYFAIFIFLLIFLLFFLFLFIYFLYCLLNYILAQINDFWIFFLICVLLACVTIFYIRHIGQLFTIITWLHEQRLMTSLFWGV